jgi:LysR family transcriptional regulator, regulator for metE and metH
MFQPRLEVRHLRMLQVMSRTGNITRAAAALCLTQSALSHQIREAERRLGLKLFVRGNKRMQMTPAALTLNEDAGRILAQLERMENSVVRDGTEKRHIVRIGCGAYSCYRWLPRFLKGFQASAADIDVEVVADATQQPLKALLDRKIDVAVTSGIPHKTSTRSLRLFRDELVLITARDHPLAKKKVIVAHDLTDQVYISYSDVAEKGHEYESLLKPAHVSYRRLMKVGLTEAIVELVLGGFGVSILSRWAVAYYLRSGALSSARVTNQGLYVDWYAAACKSERMGSPAWRLATALQSWCGNDQLSFTQESAINPSTEIT